MLAVVVVVVVFVVFASGPVASPKDVRTVGSRTDSVLCDVRSRQGTVGCPSLHSFYGKKRSFVRLSFVVDV